MTSGIISALERNLQGIGGIKIKDMIQTDASINPGNSGGPLLNSSGEIIGMNTVIFSSSGSSAGVGFAVPVDTIKRIVPLLIRDGRIIRPGLGIAILPKSWRRRFGIKKGVAIAQVDPKGPAKKAGIKGMTRDSRGRYYVGDVIMTIDGQKVNSYEDIYHALDKHKIGDKVVIEYLRNNKLMSVKIKLFQLQN